MLNTAHTFYEFFAGAGMARAGLGDNWRCLLANDIDSKKAESYRLNWGRSGFRHCDVAALTTVDLPAQADLAWASFPCQDLSLAGVGAGLRGKRSGTFWAFWKLMTKLSDEGRTPRLIVLENVCGMLTSRRGKDFEGICRSLLEGGFRFGALIVDAEHFVPQSRPRLFIIAVAEHVNIPATLVVGEPRQDCCPPRLESAYRKLPEDIKRNWLWWAAPPCGNRTIGLSDLIEENPSVEWHTQTETSRLQSLMSKINREKARKAKLQKHMTVGAVYKRMRRDATGQNRQRAEVRFDNIAGCLRTPLGGSSRQFIVVVRDGAVRSRLISIREAARFMGLPDSYILPDNYNEAYHLIADGVAVPVVRFLSRTLLEPLLDESCSMYGTA